ncbi:MAG: hypothetical protein RML37_06570 [Chitinophagales bacterium]|nr:hypothetical protein [Chitinophagales bacterium]
MHTGNYSITRAVAFVMFVFTNHTGIAQPITKANIDKYLSEIVRHYGSDEVKYLFDLREKFSYQQWLLSDKQWSLVLFSLPTIIHELQHRHNDLVKLSGEEHFTYFITTDCEHAVPALGYFQTDALNNFVPRSTADSLLRYNIYVGKQSGIQGYKLNFAINTDRNISYSIHYGIYGLLEEYAAYYRSMQTFMLLYPYVIKQANLTHSKSGINLLCDYKYYVYQEAGAHYEFQLYIAWYLQYARQYKPLHYDSLMNNYALRKVFTLIKYNFEKLVNDALQLLDTVPITSHQLGALASLRYDHTEEDLCRYIVLSGILGSQNISDYVRITVTPTGDSTYKYIGSKGMYKYFKKHYELTKQTLYDTYGGLQEATLFAYLTDPVAVMYFAKSRLTGEASHILEQFMVETDTDKPCR